MLSRPRDVEKVCSDTRPTVCPSPRDSNQRDRRQLSFAACFWESRFYRQGMADKSLPPIERCELCRNSRPRYGELLPTIRRTLQENCRPYLKRALAKLPFGTWVVINGSGAFGALRGAADLIEDAARSTTLHGGARIKVYVGEAKIGGKAMPYFGWSTYLHRASMGEAGAIVDYWNRLPA